MSPLTPTRRAETFATVFSPGRRIVRARVLRRAIGGELTVSFGGMPSFKTHELSHSEILQIEEQNHE